MAFAEHVVSQFPSKVVLDLWFYIIHSNLTSTLNLLQIWLSSEFLLNP
jgi:hypothetical protein